MRSDFLHQKRVASIDVIEKLGLGADAAASAPPSGNAPLISARIIAALVRVGDGALVAAYGVLLWVLYIQGNATGELLFYVPLIASAAVILPLLLEAGGLYSIHA